MGRTESNPNGYTQTGLVAAGVNPNQWGVPSVPAPPAPPVDALHEGVFTGPWSAQVNDLIGGWIVTDCPLPLSEHDFGQEDHEKFGYVYAECMTQEDAQVIANMLNTHGIERPGLGQRGVLGGGGVSGSVEDIAKVTWTHEESAAVEIVKAVLRKHGTDLLLPPDEFDCCAEVAVLALRNAGTLGG